MTKRAIAIGVLALIMSADPEREASAQVQLLGRPAECKSIEGTAFSSEGTAVSLVNGAIDTCLSGLRAEAEAHDRVGNRLAGTSAVGALGAVASGLTSQAAGTLNAWVGVGLAPAIYDEVQQRQRTNRLRRDTVSLLEQLQCRAGYLDERHMRLAEAAKVLRSEAYLLSDDAELLLGLARLSNPGANTPNYALRMIALEGRRVAGAAQDLSHRLSHLPDRSRIGELEATVYNNIIGERDDLMSLGRTSPFGVFRSVLAAPFNAAGKFISGGQAGELPTYSPGVATTGPGLTVNYVIDFPDGALSPPIAWSPQSAPPPAEAVAAADRATAASIEQRTRMLIALGDSTTRDYARFVEAAESGSGDCPRRPVVTTSAK